jgi:hypothetical protein
MLGASRVYPLALVKGSSQSTRRADRSCPDPLCRQDAAHLCPSSSAKCEVKSAKCRPAGSGCEIVAKCRSAIATELLPRLHSRFEDVIGPEDGSHSWSDRAVPDQTLLCARTRAHFNENKEGMKAGISPKRRWLRCRLELTTPDRIATKRRVCHTRYACNLHSSRCGVSCRGVTDDDHRRPADRCPDRAGAAG